jgi:MFS superfamily sulfate permease-like transporter
MNHGFANKNVNNSGTNRVSSHRLAVWGITTGHPYMNAGVTAITALMTKSDLKGDAYISEHGENSYVQLVAAYSLTIGIASIVLSMAGFGTWAKSVPKPVRIGFKWGCSVGVLLSALPNGIFRYGTKELKEHASDSTLIRNFIAPWQNVFPGFYNVSQCLFGLLQPWIWSLPPAFMFIVGTAFIMEGSKRYLPSSFPPGVDVILVTLVAALYSHYTNYDGGTVGEIPTSALHNGASLFDGKIKIPFEILNIKQLVTESSLVDQFGGSYILLALSSLLFAAVNFISIMGIATGFESEDGIPWNANRELLAQGTSCTMAALVGSAPVSGSLSRSLVSRMTGTTSQLACIVTAFCWMYLLPYMNILSPTPKAALSAVIVSAVLKGIVVPKDLLQLSGWDALTGWCTGLMTAASTPTQGFGAGFILHFLLHLLRTTTAVTKVKSV